MTDLNLNTINVINQLEDTRTRIPNSIATSLGKMYSGLFTIGESLNLIITPPNQFACTFVSIASIAWGSIAYCTNLEAQTNGVTLLETLSQINSSTHDSPYGQCVSSYSALPICSMLLCGVALMGKRIIPQLPGIYNLNLANYNANYFNTVYTKAGSCFDQISNSLTKYMCFENGANVSVEELNYLYQAFRVFRNINNGFDTSDTTHHKGFLEFLAKNDKLDCLSILVKLGADKADCIDIFEENTALSFTRQGKNSLEWICAKKCSQMYLPQLANIKHTDPFKAAESNAVKMAVGDIVEYSRKYAQF